MLLKRAAPCQGQCGAVPGCGRDGERADQAFGQLHVGRVGADSKRWRHGAADRGLTIISLGAGTRPARWQGPARARPPPAQERWEGQGKAVERAVGEGGGGEGG